MYQALYRKYRPSDFSDVVGQKVIIKTLTNSILNNKISHAYLFSGPRGTGKTSVAKIVAKIINCQNLKNITPCNECVCCTQTNLKQNTDIIEIDAASNNGVEEIRELRNKVTLVPSYGKYKVYIIDEVHMLTTSAFNALLKTLEEPPAHIIFILATTEPHKIPQTILSRCQRYDFKKISDKDIKDRLNYVCKKENISIEESSLDLISKFSDGGMRDALSILDQLSSYTLDTITDSDVHDIYGTIVDSEIREFINLISNKDIVNIYNKIEKYDSEGKNLTKIIDQIIEYLKNTLIYLNCNNYFNDEESIKNYSETCDNLKEDQIYNYINVFLDSLKNIKTTNNVKLVFELAIIKILETNRGNQTKTEEKNIQKQAKKIEVINEVEDIEITEEEQIKIKELKQIRINNTLANFNKKDLIEFKKEFGVISNYLMNPDYSSLISLILDGDLKAKGDKNLMFVFKTDKLQSYFNNSLEKIEKMFREIFKIDFKPIAVAEAEWENIKKEFNESIKNKSNKYKYIEEIKSKQITGKKSSNKNTNTIEKNFENLIIYN